MVNIDNGLYFLKPSLETLAQKLDHDIVVITYEGINQCDHEFSPAEADNNFVVLFNLIPGLYIETEILSAYGFRLGSNQQYACIVADESTFSGKTIYDEDGYALAVIKKNALYILFALDLAAGDEGKNNAVSILDLILKDYDLYRSHPRLFVREMNRRITGKQFKRFSEVYALVRKEIVGKELKAVDNTIFALKKTLFRLTRRTSALSTSRAQGVDIDSKIVAIFNELKEMDINGKVSVSQGGVLRVNIGQIDILYQGVVYAIGDFDIVFNINGETLHCKNNTTKIKKYQHPAVDQYGRFVIGEAEYGLAGLLGRMEFPSAIKMVKSFLQEYDPETCLNDIKLWPVKEA